MRIRLNCRVVVKNTGTSRHILHMCQAARQTPRGARAPVGDGSIQYTPRRERKAAEDLLSSQRVRTRGSSDAVHDLF